MSGVDETKPMQVLANMTVRNVQRNGSDLQKRVIKLFDVDNDGIINNQEAVTFNNYEFDDVKCKSETSFIMHRKGAPGDVFNLQVCAETKEDLEKVKITEKSFIADGGNVVVDIDYSTFGSYYYNPTNKKLEVTNLTRNLIYDKNSSIVAKKQNEVLIENSKVDVINVQGSDYTEVKKVSPAREYNTKLILNKEQDVRIEGSRLYLEY